MIIAVTCQPADAEFFHQKDQEKFHPRSWGFDGKAIWWDHPTMKLVADQKRRVVLPKPAEPGDVFEVIESGDRLVLVKLVRPKAVRPPIAPIPADPRLLKGIDLDEPAFAPISDESPA